MSFDSSFASAFHPASIGNLRKRLRSSTAGRVAEKSSYSTKINVKTNGVPPAGFADAATNKDRGIEEQGTMASDEDYAAFLDKANEDPNKGVAKTQASGKIQLKAVDHGVEVPAALKEATKDAFYVSDADEPFEPVCLKHKGKTLPDEGMPQHSSFLS